MSSTDRVRDADRTRRTILDTLGQLVEERGAGVSLAEVAEVAGVTKSGLLHHFRSREDLIAAYVEYGLEVFWSEMRDLVDPGEGRPGQFSRGYVRAMTGDSSFLRLWARATSLIAHLGARTTMEHVERSAPADAARLHAAFAADGLPEETVLLIRCAADGASFLRGTPYLDDQQLETLRDRLLALTEVPAAPR